MAVSFNFSNAQHMTWKQALVIYSAVASTAAFILIALLLNATRTQQQRDADVTAREKSRDTVLAQYNQPLISASGDKILLPELKVALPAIMVSRTMIYKYVGPTYASNGTTPEGATFASHSAIVEAAKLGGNDQCNILADISVGKPKTDSGSLAKAGSTHLADGRDLFIYQNKNTCGNVWGNLDSETVVLLLKQATSYK